MKKSIVAYKLVVTSYYEEHARTITFLLSQGWKLYKNIKIVNSSVGMSCLYIQQMVKYTDDNE